MLYPVTKIEFIDLLVLGNGVLKIYNKFIRQRSPEFFSDYFRGDFNSLSEDQKLRSVRKTMDNIMLEVRDMYCLLQKWKIFHAGSTFCTWTPVPLVGHKSGSKSKVVQYWSLSVLKFHNFLMTKDHFFAPKHLAKLKNWIVLFHLWDIFVLCFWFRYQTTFILFINFQEYLKKSCHGNNGSICTKSGCHLW